MHRKKTWYAILLLSTILLITVPACSSKTDNSQDTNIVVADKQTENLGEQTPTKKKVTHMKGDTEIPVNPKRLIDVSGSAEELLILGQPFIATANTSMFDGRSIPDHIKNEIEQQGIEIVGNYAGVSELNLEKIAELQPDMIIMNIRHEQVYDQLAQIAPTVMLDDDINYVNWRDRFGQLGAWFDKTDIADKWLAELDQTASALSEEIRALTKNETFAVIEANSVHFGSYYVYGTTGGPGDVLFSELQLPYSDTTPVGEWGKVVDIEYLANIDTDHIFFFSDDGTIGDLANSNIWNNLKAVKNGNVYNGLNNLQYNMAYTPTGKSLFMEKMARAIINHENIQ